MVKKKGVKAPSQTHPACCFFVQLSSLIFEGGGIRLPRTFFLCKIASHFTQKNYPGKLGHFCGSIQLKVVFQNESKHFGSFGTNEIFFDPLQFVEHRVN